MRKLNSRSVHRYLSIFIGIQLFLWSLSGLMFCWLPYDQVLAKHHLKTVEVLDLGQIPLFDVRELLERLNAKGDEGVKITSVTLRTLLDRPVYEIQLNTAQANVHHQLYDARSGELISPISRELAIEIARADFDEDAEIKSTTLVTSVESGHSEYRGKELPAWQIDFDHGSRTSLYISADRGIITARRNVQWRVFDFFWMLHTMDYQGRDNFNTWLLWIATCFSLASVMSGFWLWWRSSRLRSRWRHRIRQRHQATKIASSS